MQKLFQVIISIIIVQTTFITILPAQSKSDILNKEIPLTWMGVDFTEARYSGDPGKESFAEMREQFSKINLLILQESGKYDLEKIFHKSKVVSDIEWVQIRNHGIDPENIPAAAYGELNRLDPGKISEIIKHY